jgi:hypothetical protein
VSGRLLPNCLASPQPSADGRGLLLTQYRGAARRTAALATSSQDTGEEALQRGLLLRVEHGEEAAHRLALAPAQLDELHTPLRREVYLDHPLVGGLPCAHDETGLPQPLARGDGRARRDAERLGQGSDAVGGNANALAALAHNPI